MSTKSLQVSNVGGNTRAQLEARGLVPITWTLVQIGQKDLNLIFQIVITPHGWRHGGWLMMAYYATPEDHAACLTLWNLCYAPRAYS